MKIVEDSVFLKNFMDQDIYLISKNISTSYPEASDMDEIEAQLVNEDDSNPRINIIIEKVISGDEENLLSGILKAVNLSLSDVTLIRMDPLNIEIPDELQNKNGGIVISFGITTIKSNLLNIESRYTPTTVEGYTVLIADSLSVLNQNLEYKKKLWAVLQKLF